MPNKNNGYDKEWSNIGHRELVLDFYERNLPKASPVLVDSYIESVEFPANKEDLIDVAKKNRAPSDVMYVLEQFEEKEYNDAIDVSKEISRIH